MSGIATFPPFMSPPDQSREFLLRTIGKYSEMQEFFQKKVIEEGKGFKEIDFVSDLTFFRHCIDEDSGESFLRFFTECRCGLKKAIKNKSENPLSEISVQNLKKIDDLYLTILTQYCLFSQKSIIQNQRRLPET